MFDELGLVSVCTREILCKGEGGGQDSIKDIKILQVYTEVVRGQTTL